MNNEIPAEKVPELETAIQGTILNCWCRSRWESIAKLLKKRFSECFSSSGLSPNVLLRSALSLFIDPPSTHANNFPFEMKTHLKCLCVLEEEKEIKSQLRWRRVNGIRVISGYESLRSLKWISSRKKSLTSSKQFWVKISASCRHVYSTSLMSSRPSTNDSRRKQFMLTLPYFFSWCPTDGAVFSFNNCCATSFTSLNK